MEPRSVLFVCTANICRSPMAMALWEALVTEREGIAALENWRIGSAGTWTREGAPAARPVKMVLKEQGLNVNAHRSREVTREMLSAHSLILVMERGHKEALRVEFPELAGRIYLLSEMAGRTRDIQDPIQGTLLDFQDTAREIQLYLKQGYKEIVRRAAARES